MIPGNQFTPTPLPSLFVAPYDRNYNPNKAFSSGGVAIGDPSQGRDMQNWEAAIEGDNIVVRPEGGAVQLTLSAPGAVDVTLAFDGNMAATVAWLTGTTASLYYYDSIVGGYITKTFADVTSCRVCIDDIRTFNTTNSDILLVYTKGGNLYWRQQRDRYDVERLVGATANRIVKAGPSETGRLQIALVPF